MWLRDLSTEVRQHVDFLRLRDGLESQGTLCFGPLKRGSCTPTSQLIMRRGGGADHFLPEDGQRRGWWRARHAVRCNQLAAMNFESLAGGCFEDTIWAGSVIPWRWYKTKMSPYSLQDDIAT